ncbi:MAG: hypothetical protein ABI113_20600 [Mucilaginibacter sp.]
MANPLWKVGMKSPNAAGRAKNSCRTAAGMCERFVKRHYTAYKLGKLLNTLSDKEKLNLYVELLPYTVPRKQAETITSEEVDKLYSMIENSVKNNTDANRQAVS